MKVKIKDRPPTWCDRPGHRARAHGTMTAYTQWGCRCKAAIAARHTWRAAWVKTPSGQASIKRTNDRRRAQWVGPTGVTNTAMARAERDLTIITWTNRGETVGKIAAEIGRTPRQVQRMRARLRQEGRIK